MHVRADLRRLLFGFRLGKHDSHKRSHASDTQNKEHSWEQQSKLAVWEQRLDRMLSIYEWRHQCPSAVVRKDNNCSAHEHQAHDFVNSSLQEREQLRK